MWLLRKTLPHLRDWVAKIKASLGRALMGLHFLKINHSSMAWIVNVNKICISQVGLHVIAQIDHINFQMSLLLIVLKGRAKITVSI